MFLSDGPVQQNGGKSESLAEEKRPLGAKSEENEPVAVLSDLNLIVEKVRKCDKGTYLLLKLKSTHKPFREQNRT